MFTYHSKGLWSNSVLCHLLVSGLIWLPVASLGYAVSIETAELKVLFEYSVLLLIIGLYLLKRAMTKLKLPRVEVSSEHLVLNMPLYKRTVYNLNKIESVSMWRGCLFFRHLGWPVVAVFPYMSAKQQTELLTLLRGDD